MALINVLKAPYMWSLDGGPRECVAPGQSITFCPAAGALKKKRYSANERGGACKPRAMLGVKPPDILQFSICGDAREKGR